MKHKTNTYRSLSRLTFSLGSILLILGLLLGMFPQPVSATVAPEWDKSSLSFKGSCTGNCEVVKAKVCNTGDRDMAGPSSYEVYWAASGNPKDGTIVASGTIPALKKNTCTYLTYDPKTNPNGSAGNYMFKAYQRPGHPGTGVLWSTQCSIGQCSLPTATPVTPTDTPVTPTATPIKDLELSYECTDGGQRWEVFNPNPFDIDYQWVSSTSASGSGTAPANGYDDFWVFGMGPMTITITYGNSLSLSATSEACEEPTEEPTDTPTNTPSPTPTEEVTETPVPTEEPTEEPTQTPVVTETPSPTTPVPTEQPTKTEVPPTKTPTPVGTDDPGSPTPEITETVVTTPQPTSSGRDEDRDSQPPATLAPPTGSNTAILIPVTGGDLSQPKPFGTASLLFINFGLALLGFGLILNGLGRR